MRSLTKCSGGLQTSMGGGDRRNKEWTVIASGGKQTHILGEPIGLCHGQMGLWREGIASSSIRTPRNDIEGFRACQVPRPGKWPVDGSGDLFTTFITQVFPRDTLCAV